MAARFILKFFFHSLSAKISLNKLSHHCSVLPDLLHILPRQLILRIRRSLTTVALYYRLCRLSSELPLAEALHQ